MARSTKTGTLLVDSTTVENALLARAGTSTFGHTVARAFGARVIAGNTTVVPSGVRKVTWTFAAWVGLGLAMRTKVSNIPVEPSERYHFAAGASTPWLLWPPRFVAAGQYIERSTMMGRPFVHSTTAESAGSRSTPGTAFTRTVFRLVAGIVNVVVTGVPPPGRRNVIVTFAALALGLATRISSSKNVPVAPSARYHFVGDWAEAGRARAPSTQARTTRRVQKGIAGRGDGTCTMRRK